MAVEIPVEAEEVPEEYLETVDGVAPQEEVAVEIREAAVVVAAAAAVEGVVVVAEVEEEATNEIKCKMKKLQLFYSTPVCMNFENETKMCSE